MATFLRKGFPLFGLLAGLLLVSSANANTTGSIFVTGHDPDFHSQQGPNIPGAKDIIDLGLSFVRNGSTAPILFLETDPGPNNLLGDHVDSLGGLLASGYTAGTTAGNHFVMVNATQFLTVDFSLYSAIFLPSDHGGSLTGTDLQSVNARSADIINYINAGGGLMALAEDGDHALGVQPLFGFLPFLVTSNALSEAENGNTLTAAGLALGLTNADINGNFSHNIFTSTGGMNVVDTDSGGQILSLDFRGQVTSGGVAPEPGSIILLGSGLVCLLRLRRKS